ncbi:MAG: hypothetical protein V1720_14425 [bacterium]
MQDEKRNSNDFAFDADVTNSIAEETKKNNYKIDQVENIKINDESIRGPLVIFFGPSNIGKTVSVLRLIKKISAHYTITTNRDFRKDDKYPETIKLFEKLLTENNYAPDATGKINFILLDVTRTNDGPFCQILEAPGEHFFDSLNPTKKHPRYLVDIFNNISYSKIYVFFFAVGMFEDQEIRKQYANNITTLISSKLDSKRDKVIILVNKCDEHPAKFKNGKPDENRFKNDIYQQNSFGAVRDILQHSGFKRIHFVPFSACEPYQFESDGEIKKVLASSADYYPEKLWYSIYDCVKGKFPFSFRNIFG